MSEETKVVKTETILPGPVETIVQEAQPTETIIQEPTPVVEVLDENDTTVTDKLTAIIIKVLPRIMNTNKMSDLGTVHPTPYFYGKGRTVDFTWRKPKTFRMDEDLNVREYDWTNSLTITEDSREAERLIREKLQNS